jgi:hypothetical protein
MMLRRTILLAFLLALLTSSACSSCRQAPAEPTGSESAEDMAQKYLQAVQNKDYDLFESLLLGKDDFRPFARQMNKQQVTVFHQFVLRDFQTKNQDYLGKPLKFVTFRLGQEIWTTDKYSLYRGSTIIADLPDGSKVNLEINFVSRLGTKWKIFSLRYIKDIKGANPGAPPAPPVPGTLPGAKFGPEANDVQLKVKKVEPGAQPPAPDAEAPGAPAPAVPAPPPAPPAPPPAPGKK